MMSRRTLFFCDRHVATGQVDRVPEIVRNHRCKLVESFDVLLELLLSIDDRQPSVGMVDELGKFDVLGIERPRHVVDRLKDAVLTHWDAQGRPDTDLWACFR